MKNSLQQQLLDELKKNEGIWIKKIQLYVLGDSLGYSPETVGRCLRDLAESGAVNVGYYDGKYSKNLAKYSYKPQEVKRKVEIVEIDGVFKAVYA